MFFLYEINIVRYNDGKMIAVTTVIICRGKIIKSEVRGSNGQIYHTFLLMCESSTFFAIYYVNVAIRNDLNNFRLLTFTFFKPQTV